MIIALQMPWRLRRVCQSAVLFALAQGVAVGQEDVNYWRSLALAAAGAETSLATLSQLDRLQEPTWYLAQEGAGRNSSSSGSTGNQPAAGRAGNAGSSTAGGTSTQPQAAQPAPDAQGAGNASPNQAPEESPPANPFSSRLQQTSDIKMYGHFFSSQSFALWSPNLQLKVTGEFPVPGRVKICENNSAMPRDRVFFNYNHFHNALAAGFVDLATPNADSTIANVNRFTAGFEKTFFDQQWSVELRMPMVGIDDALLDPGFFGAGMSLGNLAILNKWLIYETRDAGISIGASVSLPTGDDGTFIIDQEVFRLRNDAVHITPFVGFLWVPLDRWFLQGFAEVDIPLIGNRLDAHDLTTGGQLELGRLNAQTVSCIDLSLGYWWYRDPFSRGVTAVTSAFEFHYASTLVDADSLIGTANFSNYDFGSFRNRFDVPMVTGGVDVQLRNRLDLRVATVLPLNGGDNRFFDAEVQASVNYRF